jgi:hypothetical protein
MSEFLYLKSRVSSLEFFMIGTGMDCSKKIPFEVNLQVRVKYLGIVAMMLF